MPGEHDILRNVLIFRDLEDPYLSSLWKLITVREVSPKERIFEEGTPVTELCIVTDGVVHVRRRAGKRELLLNRLGPGDFFGEINLFDPGTATATVVAMKPTQLAVIPHRALLAWFDVNPTAGYRVVSAFMREMSRRFRMVNSRLANSAYWKPGPAVEG
jgi:CRP-like cAMP-binding protein